MNFFRIECWMSFLKQLFRTHGEASVRVTCAHPVGRVTYSLSLSKNLLYKDFIDPL